MIRGAALRRLVCLVGLPLALVTGWMLVAPAEPSAAPAGLHHDLVVRLDPVSREVIAEDVITLQDGDGVEFSLDRRFAVERVLADGVPAYVTSRAVSAQRNLWRVTLDRSPPRTLTVRYRGRLDPLPAADHRQVLRGLRPLADPRGSFLPGGSGWYPEFGDAPFAYRVALDLPADQRGLVPGRLVDEQVDAGRYRATFAFAHPAETIDLIAGPYRVRERTLPRADGDPIRLRTYFPADLDDLADEYLSAVGGFLDLYSRWIGPYPFTEFSVVSSPLPTGFGMATLTYLGADVLRLPFIRDTSLGHEILHNWWGNGVYVDYARGNWSEGLTAFMADYAYKEREGPDAAREARLAMLRDIAAIRPDQDMPLRTFTSRTHGTSQIVGYHKGTLLFLMLRDLIGHAAFDAGVRSFWRDHRFRRASWADLACAFETASGKDLGSFFDQWLGRRGVPRIVIEGANAERTASGYRVRIVLAQDEPTYTVGVPLAVSTSAGRVERRLDIAARRQEFVVDTASRPVSVALDPDFRTLRLLDPSEAPPILRNVIVDPATVTIAATSDPSVRAAAADLARRLLDYGLRIGEPEALPMDVPLLVIGLSPDVDRWLGRSRLPARPDRVGMRGTAQVWTARQPDGRVLAVVSAESRDALKALLRPLPHHGRQSFLVFEGQRVVERGIWPTPVRELRLEISDQSNRGL
jgi:hypothetical protein